jgi:hypothetical protein
LRHKKYFKNLKKGEAAMNHFNHLMYLSIFFSASISAMVHITEQKHINPFAGRIVAYKTNIEKLGAQCGFKILDDTTIKYGIVSNGTDLDREAI